MATIGSINVEITANAAQFVQQINWFVQQIIKWFAQKLVLYPINFILHVGIL